MPRYHYYGPARELHIGEQVIRPGDAFEADPRVVASLRKHRRHHIVEVIEEEPLSAEEAEEPLSDLDIDSPIAEADEA